MGNRVFSVVVGDRTVFVITGPLTQTVNVCTPHNVRGEYDVTYRMQTCDGISPATLPTFESIEELGSWLTTERDAVTDDVTGAPPLAVATGPLPSPGPWLSAAVGAVEAAIDRLVRGFVTEPYRHRVEHSLHAELFAILHATEHVAGLHPVGTSGHASGLVHKEWPEAVPREGKRRGNVDLALVTPSQLAAASLDQFRFGRIAAPVAVEIGLDYAWDHLEEDAHKLANSRVPHGYLVHLSRGTSRDERVERFVTASPPGVRTAYANLGRDGKVAVKLLGDDGVTLRER